MKSCIPLVLLATLCIILPFTTASAATVTWLTNYEQAVNQSKETSKPIILFFTGSDWCPWCTTLEEEVLDTSDFAEAAGDKFIFVKLDFPQYSPQDAAVSAQNKQLQRKYDIRSFPSIVIINSAQQQIGVTGYRAGGPKAYAAHLLNIVNSYSGYKDKLGKLGQTKLSSDDLKALLAKAQELNLVDDALRIVNAGLQSDQKLIFQIERYRFLAEEGQIHSDEAHKLRKQILESDPKNDQKAHFQVAVIDFEAYSEGMERENYPPEIAVAPLQTYIDQFGTNDKENLWRLQMLISQTYLDKNKLSKALQFAQRSFETAPQSVRNEISTSIQNIQAQIATR